MPATKRRSVLPPWPAKPTARGPKGRLLCRCGCGAEVPSGRRTWATPECIDRVRLNCDWRVVRHHVYERDRGLCQVCTCHPESLRAAIREALAEGDRQPYEQARKDGWPSLNRVWYDIDHITPVCEGGAQGGRRNLRVLCFRCHSERTKAQNAARRAKAA